MGDRITMELEVDGREHLISHIEHLQGIITLRNEKIARYEAERDRPLTELEQKAYDNGRKEGWAEAHNAMRGTISDLIQELGKLDRVLYDSSRGCAGE